MGRHCLVLTFPLLLWIAARCRPCFIAAAQFIITLAIVWMTTFEIGLFGDPIFSIDNRILTAQAIILSFSFCALVLGALFAERREHEIRLKEALKTGERWPSSGMFAVAFCSLARTRRNFWALIEEPPLPAFLNGSMQTIASASMLAYVISAPITRRTPSATATCGRTASKCGSSQPEEASSTRQGEFYVSEV